MLRFRHPALALFMLAIFSPTLAWGQAEKVGIITTLVGNVTARRAILPAPVTLKFKDDVFYEDTITTGDQSLARVLLGGKSIVTVRERSVLTITESPGRSFINLESGKIGLAVARDRLAPGESIDIRTPNAVVGVRGTVVVTEVLPGVSNIYFLRGSGECSVLDPRTGRRIGAPVIVKPFEAFRVVGSTMRIDPIPPSQVGQITAGLEGKGYQHIEAANQEQVKKQVTEATAAVVGALASGAAVGVDSEGRIVMDTDLRVVVPNMTGLRLTSLPSNPPPSNVPSNITIDPLLVPFAAVAALAPTPVVQIPAGTAPLTILKNAFEITTATPTPANLGRPLLQTTLQTTDGGLMIGGSLLSVGGPLSSTSSLPVLSTDPTTITTGADFIRIASGAQVSVNSSLVSDTDGKFTVGGSVLAVVGGASLTSSSASPLVQFNNTNVNVLGDFVRLGGDGSASGEAVNLSASLISVTKGALKIGSVASIARLLSVDKSTVTNASVDPLIAASEAAVRTSGDLVALSQGAALTTSGPLISATASRISSAPGTVLSLSGGSTLTAGSGLDLSGTKLRSGSLFTAAGGSVLKIVGGSLLSLTNGSTANVLDGAFLAVSDGAAFRATPGSLAAFGTGMNRLHLQNAPLCSTGNCIRLFSTAYSILLRNGATVGNVSVDPAFVAFVGLGGENTITGVDAGVDSKQAVVVLDGAASSLILGASPAPSITIRPGQIIDPGIPQVFSTLTIAGGTLKGSDSVRVLNALEWTSGQIAGAGPLLVNGVIDLTTSGFKDLQGRTLTSEWRTRMGDTGVLGMSRGAVFNNTGRFEALSEAGLENSFGGEATFLNAGTFVKTGAGTTTSISDVTFNNTGTVDVQSGTLSLAGGATSRGSFTIGAGGTLEFARGVSTLTSASSVAGNGTLRFAGGTTDILGTYLATGPLLFTGGNATFNTANSILTPSLTIQSGSGTFNRPLTAGSLSLSGGILNGASDITVSGRTTWTGGQIAGSGELVASGGLELSGDGFKDLRGRTLTNAGTARFTDTGTLGIAQGALFNNTGRFEAVSDADIGNFFGGTATFANKGTFVKTGVATGTGTGDVVFNNTGTVDVQSGLLALSGGGTSTGAFTVATAATLVFGGATNLQASSSLTGAGAVEFRAGVTNILGVYDVGNTSMTGGFANFNTAAITRDAALTAAGVLAGTGSLTVTGQAVWSTDVSLGGGLTGTLNIANGAGLDISGPGLKFGSGGRLINSGTAIWRDSGPIRLDDGSVIDNRGRFEVQNDTFLGSGAGSNLFVNNSGTFVKSGGTGTTAITGRFNNTGSVEVLSGTLSLQGGGISTGSITGTGTVEFATVGLGGYTVAGTYNVQNTVLAANTVFNTDVTSFNTTLKGAGGLAGTGVFTTRGRFDWSGGSISGRADIANAATLDINGSAFRIIDGGVLNNAGFATWQSTGEFGLDRGGVINNTGRFEAQTDQAIVLHTGPLGTVNNLGTFAKTGGTGITSITANFNNTGRVDVLSGTLALSGGGLSSGTFNIAAGASLALGPDPAVLGAASLHDLTAAASLLGGGAVRVGGNVRFGAGTVYRLTGTTTLTSGNLTAVADLIALGVGETFSPTGSILIRNGGVVTVPGAFVDVAAGGTLNSASTASLLVLNEGVGVISATSGSLLHVVASSVANAPPVSATVSLFGPLAMVTGSTLTTTSDLVGVFNGGTISTSSTLLSFARSDVVAGNDLVRVVNGAQVVPPIPNPSPDQPFVTLDNSTVTTSGNVLTVRGSLSGVPSRMALTGPLFVATNNSRVNSASGFVIDQGAELTGTSTRDLIRLVNSAFTSGPAASANFFEVASDPLSVMPSAVSIAGRLLSTDSSSTVTTPFSLLSVFRSSFTSTTPNALIEAVNSVLAFGRDPTQPGSQTLGRVLTVTASPSVPATVALSGPLALLTGTNVTATEIFVGVFGGFVSSTTGAELIQLTNSTVRLGSSTPGQEIFGRALFITGQGGPGGTATLTLRGPLLSSVDSALTVTGRLVEILPGAQVTANGTGDAPLISITGGTHAIGTLAGSSLFFLQGRSTGTAGGEPEDGGTLDEPIKTSRTLLATSRATIDSQAGAAFDTMLFQATAPIFRASAGSNLTFANDAILFSKNVKMTSSSPVIALDGSRLTSKNGAILNLAANSSLVATGDLFSLSNGSQVKTENGPLIRVNASVLDVPGALAAFLGTGNVISVKNSLCSSGCVTFPGGSTGDITVKLVGAGSTAFIGPNPFKGPGTGSLEKIGNAAVIEVVNGGRVTIGPR